MKRLIQSITLAIATLFTMTAFASATPASGWRANISSPANTSSKTFNVQYTTLSIGETDHINVELFQNNVSVGSQTTSKPYGDSGVFSVTVSQNGTYSYYIKATNSTDATPKTTSPVNVVVSDQPQRVSNTTNSGSTENNSSVSGQNSQNTTNGNNNGEVGDNPASTGSITQDNADVLGEQTKANDNKSNKTGLIIASIIALLAIAFGAYRYWLIRKDNQIS